MKDLNNLSLWDRLVLSNQFRILARLEPENADSHLERAEIVENGFALAYDWIAPHILAGEVSTETCREVITVLNMFRALHNAAIDAPSDADVEDARFPGFDGNSESEHHAFAMFLIRRQGKWPELDEPENRDLNSHTPSLGRYRRMLDTWERLNSPMAPSWEQAIEILRA